MKNNGIVELYRQDLETLTELAGVHMEAGKWAGMRGDAVEQLENDQMTLFFESMRMVIIQCIDLKRLKE